MTRTAECIPAVKADDEVQALVQYPRNRPSWVERRWTEDGHDLGLEVLLEPLTLLGGPIVTSHETNAFLAQGRNAARR